MQDANALNTSVLIVGAGPTGLTLANILGQQGIDTIIIDRKPSTVGEPRAVSIDDESLRTMQAIGLADDVLKDVVKGYGVHYYTRLGGICFGKVEPTASEYGFPRRNAFRQPLLEATLRKGLDRFACVRVLFEHTLVDFTQDANGVRANVACSDGPKTIAAAYVVGTDGGRSGVRQQIGSTLVGSSFNARWLVIDIENDDDSFWQTRAFCDADRPVVDVPGPNRTRRYEFLLKPDETDDAMLKPERIRELLRPFKDDRPVDVVRKTVYTFHARVADKWRVGRVFLAGDAAHLTPPYAGQGMNSGVRDAHNLGWKLAAVLNGMIGPNALDTYQQERRIHAWALIRLALQLGFVMAPSSRFQAWSTSAFFRATAIVPPVRDFFLKMKFKPKPRFREGLVEIEHSKHPRLVGSMAPQPLVRVEGGETVPLDDLIGHHFGLLAIDVPTVALRSVCDLPLWTQLQASKIVLCANGIRTGATLGGFSTAAVDELPASLATAKGCFILLRPDRYIAGVFDADGAEPFAKSYQQRAQSRQQAPDLISTFPPARQPQLVVAD
ncbi:bifunctional 3-(3-hydroxy-phenyl)propionate/3-hydroxycinnamic acid hydroxylase [Cupriavidus pinatubonensis]|uniref:bifunctional 3-(3-hydroxy-phenyl)propionate/3-hydroxycinnamic acid hydroxylase n=1 Tax=Cupriavidus pinatubonensis TaxID=248026 RepID=UPI00112B77FB|nr:bifunctional 3-(3-hydroxy-phenyl)propionate/3-hydroxycinnamic acid hydroxylase [Cupriavidus pinatubonensis]TPQ44152.1 3-(3-hydroxyphenyl)propionate hydroxylase [Cupriavidus pinatubonensis]